jgi:hypothetical protein
MHVLGSYKPTHLMNETKLEYMIYKKISRRRTQILLAISKLAPLRIIDHRYMADSVSTGRWVFVRNFL